MLYPILAFIFFVSLLLGCAVIAIAIFKPQLYRQNRKIFWIFIFAWFGPYFIFIFFLTGPLDLKGYPSHESSPYKLPWRGGVQRFVAQGNRSFVSHREFHEFAWDFVMPNGSEIVASRGGRVFKIIDGFDGIGMNSNLIEIEHEDDQHSVYAHIRYQGALVKVGELVLQGQPIALSGTVGQTIFPHVHFFVINKEGTSSVSISFSDVVDGVPLSGHFYTSRNFELSIESEIGL